jgi:chromate transporter
MHAHAAGGTAPTFATAFWFWLKLGFISFGGPAGQIAIMHVELVERRRWISEARFLHALNYCMLLPGPEAQQLATYIGWLLHRTRGGIVAGALFVLPSMLILWVLSCVYVWFGSIPVVAALFHGLKPAVLAIVASAVLRIGSKALKNEILWSLAAVAFIAIFFFKVPFPIIVFAAAVVGFLGGRWFPEKFTPSSNHAPAAGGEAHVLHDDAERPAAPTWMRAFRVLTLCLLLWWLPVAALGAWLGPDHALFREAIFFSKASMVTFGGAYAVLPYVSQQAVETHHWLSPIQMLDGLALAETTPGPLIMVLQFVGFLGGWNHPGSLPPIVAASLGALITTWTTFVPCFLWIFLGAPHIERLRGNKHLSTALSAVTAAIVGVILNLAVWFAMHLFFPAAGKIDYTSIVITAAALFAIVRWRWSVVHVIGAAALIGIIVR